VVGRQPQGTVQPGHPYEQLRDRIIDGMRALRTPDTDEPLVEELYRREEIFGGKHVDNAPDIVFKLHPLYRVGGNLRGPQFTQLKASDLSGPRSGWHDDYGILIAAGAGIPRGALVTGAHMLNVAPTVLNALGLRAPTWMDGTVQANVFSDGAADLRQELADDQPAVYEGERPFAADSASAEPDDAAYALSSAEEESIKERLHNLGYM
jgi:predicted AlkP superfamily phosphohydrolase/phosphomutase